MAAAALLRYNRLMQRRILLLSSFAMAAARLRAAQRLPIATAVEYSMLPQSASVPERFQIAKAAGFEQIECPTTRDSREAEAMKAAAEKAGIKIHSVMNMDHWKYPLSSPDPAVLEKSLEGARVSIRNAHLWGADTVLIVPAVVNGDTSYRDAYTRSQQSIRNLLPLAQDLKVIIAIEEVWNKFLLSPLEFSRYVDEFKSPWVRAYFDVGNIVFYGYPQDWIRTLGGRIVKVHLKDFRLDRPNGKFYWKNLGEGDIDWQEVRKAFSEIGYNGYVTVEIEGGDAAYLKDVVARLDRFLAGVPIAKEDKQS